ncbi:hypothetical protein KFE98_10290 [bacterium SCSIO 12741]|nr:hypothetical protein KFE98_10290 [bacterium SCSIO 12741]
MKTITKFLFVASLFSLAIISQSCKKDKCEEVSCSNGGVCVDGTCECPSGFSGENCQTEDKCITSGVSCQNGGTCVNGACDCPDGFTGTNCETLDLSDIQKLLDGGQTPKQLVDAGVDLKDLYGKTYEGGLIAYFNANTKIGIIAAPSDLNESVWGCNSNSISGTKAQKGMGSANTHLITDGCSDAGIPARQCSDLSLNGKSDWFLPSSDELEAFYNNLHQNGMGSFEKALYWSSNQASAKYGDAFDFSDGFNTSAPKSKSYKVRAARYFEID